MNILKNKDIQSILSLCNNYEAIPPLEMTEMFNCERVVLPDHKSDRKLEIEEIYSLIKTMKKMEEKIPIHLHYFAGKERSSLIFIAWLRIKKKIDNIQALRYLMKVHQGTCQLDDHLFILNKYVKTL